jgi:ribokinase
MGPALTARFEKDVGMVLVFGSLAVDLLLTATEHPRPGETVLCNSSRLSPGGKGNNQAVAAAIAGANAVIIGRVGVDDFGSFLIDRLLAKGVDTSYVARTDSAPTGCAVVAVDGHGQNIIYVAVGANSTTQALDVPDELLKRADVLVCQMEVPARENWSLLERAKKEQLTTILNLAPARDIDDSGWKAIKQWIDVLILNEEEALHLVGRYSPSLLQAEPSEIAHFLADALNAICIVTLGSAGVCGSDAKTTWREAALEVGVKDTTGAGDTFTGVLAAMLDEGRSIPEALRRATIGASLACRELGAQEGMPDRQQIELYASD